MLEEMQHFEEAAMHSFMAIGLSKLSVSQLRSFSPGGGTLDVLENGF